VDVKTLQRQINDLDKLEVTVDRAVNALCSCRNAKILKVKWNLSHAIGIAMKNMASWSLIRSNHQLLNLFYETLMELFTESTNFKVRINACAAFMNININTNKPNIYFKLWQSLIFNFTKVKVENDPSNEQQHKLNLIHQVASFSL
jgi:hypothetical protein